uniref:Uncharacterized protein n=1 Tax=Romanomermis culicivorax TaxID=13658 RepID=A0A915JNY3_ROMCU
MDEIDDQSYISFTEIESITKYWKLMKRNPLILDEFLRSLLTKLLDDNPHLKICHTFTFQLLRFPKLLENKCCLKQSSFE